MNDLRIAASIGCLSPRLIDAALLYCERGRRFGISNAYKVHFNAILCLPKLTTSILMQYFAFLSSQNPF